MPIGLILTSEAATRGVLYKKDVLKNFPKFTITRFSEPDFNK